jgi:hypothetical protein
LPEKYADLIDLHSLLLGNLLILEGQVPELVRVLHLSRPLQKPVHGFDEVDARRLVHIFDWKGTRKEQVNVMPLTSCLSVSVERDYESGWKLCAQAL